MLQTRLALVLSLILLLAPLTWFHAAAAPRGESQAAPSSMPSQQSGAVTLFLPFVARNSIPISPLWRFGISNGRRPIADYAPSLIAAMRFGWFVDWSAYAGPLPALGMEYVGMIRVKQVKIDGSGHSTSRACAGCPYADPPAFSTAPALANIPALVAARRGRTWIVGNEIERRDWGTAPCTNCSQDEITPELYAQAYHDVYAAIKSADPTAQVAIGGIIEATPLRLKYIQRIWNRYDALYGGGQVNTMPVEVWNVHGFVLPEIRNHWGAEIPAGLDDTVGTTYGYDEANRILANKNFSWVAWQVQNMRTWMRDHGQRNKPLIISEYGINMPDYVYPGQFTPDQVASSFMYPSFDYFRNTVDGDTGFALDGNRLVQRWNWYSLDDDNGTVEGGVFYPNYNSNLFYSGLAPNPNPQGLAPLGNYWKQYVSSLPGGASKPY